MHYLRNKFTATDEIGAYRRDAANREVMQPLTSCRPDTLASGEDGIHPDEMLGFALDP